jgi:DNA polymerase III epsilon subunit-like protein
VIDKMVFVDTETCSLEPGPHRVWEVGLVVCDLRGQALQRLRWELFIDPAVADPDSLRVGGLYARGLQHLLRDPRRQALAAQHNREAAEQIAQQLDGAVFAGINPAFDAAHLRQLMRDWGQAPWWHHHLVCAVGAAAQALGMDPPFITRRCIQGLQVPTQDLRAHCALDDAELARRLYRAARARSSTSSAVSQSTVSVPT